MIACLFQSSSDYDPTSSCRNLEINYVGDFCKPIVYVLCTKKMLTIAYVLLIAVKLGHWPKNTQCKKNTYCVKYFIYMYMYVYISMKFYAILWNLKGACERPLLNKGCTNQMFIKIQGPWNNEVQSYYRKLGSNTALNNAKDLAFAICCLVSDLSPWCITLYFNHCWKLFVLAEEFTIGSLQSSKPHHHSLKLGRYVATLLSPTTCNR
jgi:hypothetical protein